MIQIIPIILNLLTVLIVAIITIFMFRRDGKWALTNILRPLRYFTFISNLVLALGALLITIFPNVYPIWILKYAGVVGITITMLTVLVFLGPKLSYRRVLEGRDFWLHLVTPILGIVSFTVFERRKMPVWAATLGIVQVVVYGIVYAYKVLYAPDGKKWDDIYGFNKGGKWGIAVVLMLGATALVCAGYWALMFFFAK